MSTSTSFFQEYRHNKKLDHLAKKSPVDKNKDREQRWLIDRFKNKIIESRDSSLEETIVLGSLIRMNGDAFRAYKIHKNLLNRIDLTKPEKLLLYIELGTDLFHMKKSDLGESYFQQCLIWDRKHIYAMHCLSRAHEFLGEYRKAIPLLKRMIRLGEKEESRLAYVLSEHAYTLIEQGLPSKAKKISEEAMAIDPTCPAAMLAYADALLFMKQFTLATEALKTFINKCPSLTFMAIKRLEDVHYKQNQYAEMETTLKQSLQKNPDNAYLLYWMGKILRKKKRQPDGLAYFKEALHLKGLEVNAMRELVHYNLTEDAQTIVSMAKKFFEELRLSRKMYCVSCRKTHEKMHWFCSHCGHWGVFEVRYDFPGP